MLSDVERSSLAATRKLLTELRHSGERPLGIVELEVLCLVYSHQEDISGREITATLSVIRQNVYQAIGRLHEHGLVTRRKHQRELYVGRTRRGLETLHRALNSSPPDPP